MTSADSDITNRTIKTIQGWINTQRFPGAARIEWVPTTHLLCALVGNAEALHQWKEIIDKTEGTKAPNLVDLIEEQSAWLCPPGGLSMPDIQGADEEPMRKDLRTFAPNYTVKARRCKYETGAQYYLLTPSDAEDAVVL